MTKRTRKACQYCKKRRLCRFCQKCRKWVCGWQDCTPCQKK